MAQYCTSLTLKGGKCTRKALPNEKTCRQHKMKGHVHPSFKKMVTDAIIAEQSKIGSSRQYIKMYVWANYKIDPKHFLINKTIKLMLENGELQRNSRKTGHFMLAGNYKKEMVAQHKREQKENEKFQRELYGQHFREL
jgi:linker histone H1 and H5 family protein